MELMIILNFPHYYFQFKKNFVICIAILKLLNSFKIHQNNFYLTLMAAVVVDAIVLVQFQN